MKITFNNYYLNNIKNNVYFAPKKYTNLCPLAKDTVSFSARAQLIGADMINAPNNKTCILAHNNAEPARIYLEKVLAKYIEPLRQTDSNQDTHKFPIFDYITRIKSPSSIREKVVSKYAKISADDEKLFAHKTTVGLLEYFKPNKGLTPKSVEEIVLNSVQKSQEDNKIPPFTNVEYYFSGIINRLEERNILNFNEVDTKEKKAIINGIIASLNEYRPDETENHYDDDDCYINPTHIDGVKHYANDIVGGRIIMRESDKEYANIVLKALERAATDGVLKITSIQNNLPEAKRMKKDKNISDYEYASEQVLEKLAKKANAKYKKIETKTGYLGIHINVDLSNELFKLYNGVHNGYSGEIQIIGSDVLQLKEVEDLCYKIKDQKNAINSGYQPFRDYFLKYYTDDKTKKAFDDYTYDLYLAQRSLPPSLTRKDTFPTIEELGYKGKVPQELDFNILSNLKKSCDKKIELEEKEKKLAKSGKISKKESMSSIYNSGNIETLAKMIDYQLK